MQPPTDYLSPSVTSPIEVVRPDLPKGKFRAVLFDFDGTLSLIRRNWQNVMIPMMVAELAATGTTEAQHELYAHVEDYVKEEKREEKGISPNGIKLSRNL